MVPHLPTPCSYSNPFLFPFWTWKVEGSKQQLLYSDTKGSSNVHVCLSERWKVFLAFLLHVNDRGGSSLSGNFHVFPDGLKRKYPQNESDRRFQAAAERQTPARQKQSTSIKSHQQKDSMWSELAKTVWVPSCSLQFTAASFPTPVQKVPPSWGPAQESLVHSVCSNNSSQNSQQDS